MKCRKIFRLLNKHLDGQTTLEEEKILSEHLAYCPLCKERLNVLEMLGFYLKEKKVEAPAGFTENVLSRLPEKVLSPELVRRPLPTLSGWRWLPAVAVTVLFLAVSFYMLRKKNFVPSTMTMEFKIKLPEAHDVSLVGDFNDWDINATKLTRQNSFWTVKLSLPPGRYQYVFVIDGARWLPDPQAKNYVDSAYGGKNSILDIAKL